jgi:MFS family permease
MTDRGYARGMASRRRVTEAPRGREPVTAAAVAASGLTALAVAMGVGRFAFTPILPLLQQERGLSVADGAWLASANYLGYLLGAVAVSVLATRVRPATGIRGGLLVIAIATLGMGLAERFDAWVALRALAGVASASVLVFASAWCLERLARAGRPQLSGMVFAGVGVGMAVAGVYCLALMRAGAGSRQAWIGLGVASLAATVATWRVFGAGETVRADGDRRTAPPARWFDAETARLLGCYGAFGFGYIIPATFVPAMARQVVHDPMVFGWCWPVFGAAAAVSPLAAAAVARRLGTRRVWTLGHLVMAVGVALPAWRPGIGGILIAALLVGGTFMVITQAGMQEARAVAGPRATRLMAAMTAAFAAGQIVGPLSVGYLVGPAADFSRPLLAASLALLASALTLSLPRPPIHERGSASRGRTGRADAGGACT